MGVMKWPCLFQWALELHSDTVLLNKQSKEREVSTSAVLAQELFLFESKVQALSLPIQ